MLRIVGEELEDAGVDLRATVTGPDGTPVPRFATLTFGNETSLSDFQRCKHVIFLGLMERDGKEMAASIIAASRDLKARAGSEEIRRAVESEYDHVFLQGLSRGHSRVCEDGQAGGSDIYLVHHDQKLRERMTRFLPGVTWVEWEGSRKQPVGKAKATAQKAQEYLQGLPEGERRVSSVALKKHVAPHLTPRQWQNALDVLLARGQYTRDRRHISACAVSDQDPGGPLSL